MSNKIISEEEFENLPASPPDKSAVAIDQKHASITVVVPSNISPSPSERVSMREASGSTVIERGVALSKDIPDRVHNQEISSSRPINMNESSDGVMVGKNIDKINNLFQKEIALGRVGVTREKAYRVIASALEAHKWVDTSDEQGNIRREYLPDLDKQRWGAEMAIKMFGDMIERKEIEMDVGDKTLDRFRAMSVAELKSRAADLLLGRTKAVDAEVVG